MNIFVDSFPTAQDNAHFVMVVDVLQAHVIKIEPVTIEDNQPATPPMPSDVGPPVDSMEYDERALRYSGRRRGPPRQHR